jgi:superfamily I DNA and/or RNA helicase
VAARSAGWRLVGSWTKTVVHTLQVGDHYQLPPLVANPAAEAGGLGRSLFRILCEAHPQVNMESHGMTTKKRQWQPS